MKHKPGNRRPAPLTSNGPRRPAAVRARAFTLVELLVVIAILSLLAAILFPVFARVRENSRRSSCASNLKQIGLAVMQYAQDYDEVMVPGWLDGSCQSAGGAGHGTNSGNCGGVAAADNYKWMDLVYPYVKNEQVFNCPSARPSYSKYSYANGTRYGHYSANVAYKGPNNGTDTLNAPFSHYRETAPGVYLRHQRMVLTRIEAPATTVMVVDGRSNGGQPFGMSWDTPTTTPSTAFELRAVGADSNEPTARTWVYTGSSCCGISERHLGTINVLWADGHVKAASLDQLTAGKTVPVSTNGGSPTNRHVYTAWTVEDD